MIKRFAAIIIFLFVLIPKVSAISASGVVAMDLNSNRVLYNQNMHQKRLIASISKIMTCIIAIEKGDLNEEITVGSEVLKAYGSAIYIELGEKLKLSDLLYGLMLRSGNDAAIEIAYAIAGDMPSFTKMMNEKARELGMQNTFFVNAHGLEERDGNGNTSTAYDMALLTSYAYHNETFKKIFSTKDIIIKSDKKTYNWHNKNRVLHSYDFITGGKTGYTKKARRTLVTTAEKDNKRIVVVTLNDGNDFSDHITLYQDLFKKYLAVEVINKDYFHLSNCDMCYVKNNYYALVTPSEKNKLSIETIVEKNSNSEYAGKIRVLIDKELLHEEIIYKNINNKDYRQPGLWQKLWNWIRSW